MKNARKFLLKALVSKKEISTAMVFKLCAASLFKVLYTYTNFLSKSRKCCHGSNGRQLLQVGWAGGIAGYDERGDDILVTISQFSEIVAWRSGDFQIMPVAIHRNRFA